MESVKGSSEEGDDDREEESNNSDIISMEVETESIEENIVNASFLIAPELAISGEKQGTYAYLGSVSK